MRNVVFDLGKVLIDWYPVLAFEEYFADSDAALAWMAHIDFAGWNLAQDGGRSFADGLAAAEAAHGEKARPLTSYIQNFPRTIRQPIAGTWAIVESLHRAGTPIYALTNWGAETWPAALAEYPALSLFRDIVVSGHEGMRKPHLPIYQLLLQRNGLHAADTVFIDDVQANVDGAIAAGMQAIRFVDAQDLRQRLAGFGLPV